MLSNSRFVIAAIILAASACNASAQVPQLWKQKAGDATKITPTGATPYKVELPNQLISTLATGTAPFSVASTTAVTNLSIGGNAATATALATGRTINGTTFDGTSNITVASAAGTLTGATLASNVLASSLTSVGTLTGLSATSSNTTQSGTSSAFVFQANSLTTGSGLYANSTSITNGNVVDLRATSTAATTGQTTLSVKTSGATSANAITTYAADITNNRTNATSGTNVALLLNAYGATSANYSLLVETGLVGIGTLTPTHPLTLYQAINTNGVRISSNQSSPWAIGDIGASLLFTLRSNNDYGGAIKLISTNTTGLALNPRMGFFTEPTGSEVLADMVERFTILSGGNVGVGMTNPARVLDVTGTFGVTGVATFGAPITLKGYTVAGLPTGVVGHVAYVTDSLAPTYGVTVVGGGAVTTIVFFDGATWKCH